MLVAQEKFLLVRSFPGPVGSPILNVGGLSTPQLPDHYHYTNPGHNLGMQAAMRDLFQFPLAVFLCGFAGPRVYYTYSVWWERTTDLYWMLVCRYDVRQSVPDREVAEDSQYPPDWTQYNDMNPGPPVGTACTGLCDTAVQVSQPHWEGRRCSRQFRHFNITVNLEDENSAAWSYFS